MMTDGAAALDLDAYRRRIGDEGPLAPTRTTLERMIQRHTVTIPFENTEVLLGGVPQLNLDSLQDKLVAHRRGGYCYEQNGLFLAVLCRLGFTVRPLEARVRSGVAAEVGTARTHFALAVTLEGAEHLVDVGFGGLAPTVPLVLLESGPQHDAVDTYRLQDAGAGRLMLQIAVPDGWSDCYVIQPGSPEPIDAEAGNWFVATHPHSMLRHNLLLGRAVPGARLTLFNRKFTSRRGVSKPLEERVLVTRDSFERALTEEFGLALEPAEVDVLYAVVERQDAAQPHQTASATSSTAGGRSSA